MVERGRGPSLRKMTWWKSRMIFICLKSASFLVTRLLEESDGVGVEDLEVGVEGATAIGGEDDEPKVGTEQLVAGPVLTDDLEFE